MPEAINKKIKSFQTSKGTISKSVKDYGNEPFFVKKTIASRKFLEKNGFPEFSKQK